ncbi:MAG: terminase family protein [Gammaproteobacteria bacterium]|nr:terminase family protein [Gammaproteobacteria bacterium]
MAELNVDLHPAQLEIFNSEKRFKVVAAGRRFGKSRLAAWILLIKAIQSEEKDVFYIGPTFQQAKDIMWIMLKELGQDLIASAHENTAVLTLINGRRIFLKGSDRPDTLRGVGLSYVVLDEYASMKPVVWEQIIRPTLADVRGGAMFIGTPAGKNHFYDLYTDALDNEDWDAWQFNSTDNPFIPDDEIDAARSTMSSMSFRQEFEASFETFSGGIFKEDWFKTEEEPEEGSYVIAIDPAGFEAIEKERNLKRSRLDETAIAIVKIDRDKWWVKDILHGRWNIKETAKKILKSAVLVESTTVGIETGSLKNAIMPYLEDEMRTQGQYVSIIEMRHGGKKKNERIVWALQGRMEHGQITYNEDRDWRPFISQMLDFPNKLSHDDMLDALAYIDQVSVADFAHTIELEEDWQPYDEVAGY